MCELKLNIFKFPCGYFDKVLAESKQGRINRTVRSHETMPDLIRTHVLIIKAGYGPRIEENLENGIHGE